MSLCFITPRLPPAIDGLGHYCHQLWQFANILGKDRSGAGLPETACSSHLLMEPWTFLVLEGAQASRRIWPQVRVEEFGTSQSKLLEQLQAVHAETVVLQYVGYGFDPHGGAPMWLPDALGQWRSAKLDRRLLIMFHETWPTAKPWQKVFWQIGRQRRCAGQLLDAASVAVTSNWKNEDSLRSLNSSTPIKIIPIGSSFSVSPADKLDWKHLLIFGKEYARLRAIKNHSLLIQRLTNKKIVDGIVLAGQSVNPDADAGYRLLKSICAGANIITAYNFDSVAVPDVVRSCGLSLMHTQSTYLLKSTSFQLAAQLGQVAITIDEYDADPPFKRNEHYLSYRPNEIDWLCDKLRDSDCLFKVSRNCSKVAADCLSWTNIAESWCRLLNETVSNSADRG